MTEELVLTNARVVTWQETFPGTVRVLRGLIADVARGASAVAGAVDCDGDCLLPGLVELHTDTLERHLAPRPGVRWSALPAVVAHDGECAAAGITTVLDALALGDVSEDGRRLRHLRETVGALQHAVRLGVLRADHFLHLRCEVTYPQVLELFAPLAEDRTVRLVSVVDHHPPGTPAGTGFTPRGTGRRSPPSVASAGCRWPATTTPPWSTSRRRCRRGR